MNTNTLNPRWTFGTFVVGPSNSDVYNTARLCAGAPGSCGGLILIHGGQGMGKTHLLHAIGHEVLRRRGHCSCQFLPAAGADRSMLELRQCPVLLVDDINTYVHASSSEIRQEFSGILDARKRDAKLTVATDGTSLDTQVDGNREQDQWHRGSPAVRIGAPDINTAMAILQSKVALMRVQFSCDSVHFIARNLRSSVRRMEHGLMHAVCYESLTKKTMAIDELRRLLRGLLSAEMRENPITPRNSEMVHHRQ